MRRTLALSLVALAVLSPALGEEGGEGAKPAEKKEEKKEGKGAPQVFKPLPPPRDIGLIPLRKALVEAKGAEQWDLAARALLDALDRSGGGTTAEASRLAEGLAALHPDDIALSWRAGSAADRSGRSETALAYFQSLIMDHPESPYAVRARRAMPALLLRMNRIQESAQADEALLRERIADPALVLTRLAKTYSRLGDIEQVKESIVRLEKLAPDKVRYDSEMCWLAADAIDQLGTRTEAMQAMLRFANLFPRDRRRPQALLRAARAKAAGGDIGPAAMIVDEAMAGGPGRDAGSEGRLARGTYLDQLGRTADAQRDYREVLRSVATQEQAEEALARITQYEMHHSGPMATLAQLAGIAARGPKNVREAAAARFADVLNAEGNAPGLQPEAAAHLVSLAARVSPSIVPPPEMRLSAAALWEKVGSEQRAAELYASLVTEKGELGEAARLGLARTRPNPAPAGLAPDAPERIASLVRHGEWPALAETLNDRSLAADKTGAKRAAAARAGYATGDVQRVRAVLEPMRAIEGDAALLRGDIRALTEQWPAACADYRTAAAAFGSGAEHEWLEARLAECDAREGDADAAKSRVTALRGANPSDPALLALDLLAPRIDPLAREAAAARPSGEKTKDAASPKAKPAAKKKAGTA